MPKKPHISQEEIAAFHRAVKGTKPLIQKKCRLTPPVQALQPLAHQPLQDPITFRETQDIAHVQSEEFIAYKKVSISNKILRKLRKGQYNIDASLDLHGKSIEEAKIAIDHFMQQCIREGVRVMLIIHGKSRNSETPILKNKLNHWLRNIPMVLAFCSAGPSHGSRGAIYVLLKQRTRENKA